MSSFLLYQISFCVSPHVADPDSEGRGVVNQWGSNGAFPSIGVVARACPICWLGCCESPIRKGATGEDRMNLPGMGPAK